MCPPGGGPALGVAYPFRMRDPPYPARPDITPEALLVYLDSFSGQDALVPVIDRFNAAGPRIPWLEDRRLVISLTPRGRTRAGP